MDCWLRRRQFTNVTNLARLVDKPTPCSRIVAELRRQNRHVQKNGDSPRELRAGFDRHSAR